MRRIALLASVLLLSACTPDPIPPQTSAPPPPTVQPSPATASDVLGLTAPEMIRRFGSPGFQVREGAGLKMQWRGIACVLDAYLYPGAGGADRVAHVDARLRASGAEASQAACIAALEAR